MVKAEFRELRPSLPLLVVRMLGARFVRFRRHLPMDDLATERLFQIFRHGQAVPALDAAHFNAHLAVALDEYVDFFQFHSYEIRRNTK